MATVVVTVMAVLAALTGVSTPARADPLPPGQACDRSLVVLAWQTGGSQVRSAAQTAMLGSDADVCTFLTTVWPQRAAVDKRLSVDQLMANGGVATREAAQSALDSTDPGALDAFLDSGWQGPQTTDQRVEVDQMMAAGGSQVRAAAQKVLDSTDPGALATFLQTGWQGPYTTDQRLRVDQIMATGGPEVQTAAQRALDAGDLASLTRFLEVDWPVAAARDEETAQITDLVQLAVDAGNTAANETQAAQDEAARAQTLAAAAKQAAADAAADAAKTGIDAQQAADAARRAADAARNAASAASVALSSAAQAGSAARRAANAASQAAAAASRTSQAAAAADKAAAAAETDAGKAAAARSAAQTARNLALQAKSAADAAKHAGDLANETIQAVQSAKDAAAQSNAAAQSAADAADNAHAAGADSAAASAAAAEAKAAADRADKAADSAISYAHTAASAAYASQAAANRAADDANAAADAAEAAANDAGQAADAAAKATAHADAALAAAQASVSAAQQAQSIYSAARTAENDQLESSFEAADAAAQSLSAATQAQPAVEEWDGPQAAKRSDQTNQLIAEATDPATPQAQAVADARQVAFALADSDGAWTSSAAVDALGADDATLLDYVRDGITEAAGEDDRETLENLLALGGTDGFVAAAKAALAGSDADVTQFLTTRDYPGRQTDDRVAVDQVVAYARSKADTVVVQRGQQALDDGSDQALWAFLVTGQYAAAATDERVKVDQVLSDPDSGPELKDAAQVALDGPAEGLGQFLAVTRYQAAQRDEDTASHDLVVSTLLSQGISAATTAMENAFDAEAAAATARGAAADATGYAQQAADSANQAAGYAQDAQNSATQAEASAQQAANSAQTAVAAAKSADSSASDAAIAAVSAADSARQAASAATAAHNAAKAAHDSALAAGADAQAAIQAANDVVKEFQEQHDDWFADQRALCTEEPGIDHEDCMRNLLLEEKNPTIYAYMNGSTCQLLFNPDYNSAPPGQEKQSLYDDCINDALSPTADQDNALRVASVLISVAGQIAGLALNLEIMLAGAFVCADVCTAVLETVAPVFFPELIGVPMVGAGLIAGGVLDLGIDDVMEQETLDGITGDSELSRLLGNLAEDCLTDSSCEASGAENAANGVKLANDLRTAQDANPLWESLRETGRLPSNYVTKTQAEAAGWAPGKALWNSVPKPAQIGGDEFNNVPELVPSAPGRVWYEADVGLVGNMSRAKQAGTRLLYSNDGLAYVTWDHYETVFQLPNWK